MSSGHGLSGEDATVCTGPYEEPLNRNGVKQLRADLGSARILGQLIELFASQTPESLTELHEAITAGDARSVRAHAHKLKGSCLALAATEMADLCNELEMQADGGSLQIAGELACRIEGAFERARAALLEEAA